MALSVFKFTNAMHFTLFPLAYIVVTKLVSLLTVFIILSFDWPLVVSNTVHGSVYELAFVFGAISVDHVALACLLVEHPVARVAARVVRINLDSVPMAHLYQLTLKLFGNLLTVAHYPGVSRWLRILL
jgi:hypothetical protein